eukprot:4454982-Prymnesium_polylepis.1
MRRGRDTSRPGQLAWSDTAMPPRLVRATGHGHAAAWGSAAQGARRGGRRGGGRRGGRREARARRTGGGARVGADDDAAVERDGHDGRLRGRWRDRRLSRRAAGKNGGIGGGCREAAAGSGACAGGWCCAGGASWRDTSTARRATSRPCAWRPRAHPKIDRVLEEVEAVVEVSLDGATALAHPTLRALHDPAGVKDLAIHKARAVELHGATARAKGGPQGQSD